MTRDTTCAATRNSPGVKATPGAPGISIVKQIRERLTLITLSEQEYVSAPGISIVKQIRERLTLITLSEQEYVSALELASSGTIVGAAAYDALIGHWALKAGADILLTW